MLTNKLFIITTKFTNESQGWRTYINTLKQCDFILEVITLDFMLAEFPKELQYHIVLPDLFYIDNIYYDFCLDENDLYKVLQYCQVKISSKLNFLMCEFEPEAEAQVYDGYEFCGYDLMDKDLSISTVTNCGGPDGVYLKDADINKYGLIHNFQRAKEIQEGLKAAFPGDFHMDTYLFAIWRKLNP